MRTLRTKNQGGTREGLQEVLNVGSWSAWSARHAELTSSNLIRPAETAMRTIGRTIGGGTRPRPGMVRTAPSPSRLATTAAPATLLRRSRRRESGPLARPALPC
ncbi:hypothetical protein Ae406Ps2_6335 [Pseudonocardia sp. Ae406_Ps2]|nr:hypothetical protein Ae406Ps2_6333 [Pseudonocardia sp. Ae406_Ps2]OLL89945.1 hypothetical protein Ae406Ps2_6335 [Pseudonocardia sp. Ae406_Ps2]